MVKIDWNFNYSTWFLFKIDTIAVILIAAVATGLVSGLNLYVILETLGKAFVDNRLVTLLF